ncbi:MAG: energy-coupling factor ABC transporter ATP-binding protein [Desulfatitalea sp.]|nr:energy-coupling factor ABC transporter ATP-binding protein [Desulfatitalea sp.]NNK02549.1 energy-coupling factor ABC transporter ATP-binding protein [Desulfatitalea sp.]
MYLYQLDDIIQTYNGRPVLGIDHWTIPARCIIGLCGPNGSGKSTLLRLLGFVMPPSHGAIRFKGKPAHCFGTGVRDRVALLSQTPHLLKRSVYGNIAYGLRIRKHKHNETLRVHQAMAMVGLDAERFAKRPWYALSGGEAQRVALAMRLVLEPKVLLLDEPTTSVDAASAQLIKKAVLHAHHQWRTSLIIASHDTRWLQEICHDMWFLFQGKLLGRGQRTLLFGPWQMTQDGQARKVLTDEQHVIAADPPQDLANAVAVMDPAILTPHAERPRLSPPVACLAGTLTSLCLDKLSNRILASIMVGQTEFNLYLPCSGFNQRTPNPGDTLWISYAPQQVQWC